MSESITVRYKPILGIEGSVFQHKYIVYTNSAGERFYARGGPGSDPSDPIITPDIITEYGRYVVGTPDWDDLDHSDPDPRETIKEGNDLSSDWDAIKRSMDDIGSESHPYTATESNSNTAVDEALRRAGLPEPTKDGPRDNWSPGSGFDLPGGGDTASGGKSFNEEFRDWILDESELDGLSDTINDFFNDANTWFQRRSDPLTLDLDGDGLETTGINTTNPILFDHDGDGTRNATGWVSPDDGFLVLDRNNNGSIDNGTELFGDSTPLSGGGRAADGFAALAQEDTNSDGKISVNDTRFGRLRVWRDLNQDGISQSSELFSLASLNIVAINVAKTEHSTPLANGNQIADLGTFLKSDGNEGTLGNVTGDWQILI